MTIHRSLRSTSATKRHRSVLKRYEKLEALKKLSKWDEEKDSVFGLPKVKTLKIRIKKEKVAKEAVPGAEGAAAPAVEGAAKPAEAAKPAAKAAAKPAAKPAAPKK